MEGVFWNAEVFVFEAVAVKELEIDFALQFFSFGFYYAFGQNGSLFFGRSDRAKLCHCETFLLVIGEVSGF